MTKKEQDKLKKCDCENAGQKCENLEQEKLQEQIPESEVEAVDLEESEVEAVELEESVALDEKNLLLEEVEKLKKDLEKEKADYLRLMAEFETFRRRTNDERKNIIASANSETIKGLLPVLDDLERAMELLKTSEDEAAKEGTNLIYDKLFAYLKSQGLEVVEAKGKEFDTDFHEAVTQFPASLPEQKGKVIDVIQTGYILNEKVIRYAKVVVAL